MDYQKQADEFMAKTGTTIETKLLGNFPYFDDDKESRDVYQITLKRGKRIYSFRFGQSIANSKPGIDKARDEYTRKNGDSYMAQCAAKKKFPYNPPSAYDILACVQKNDPGTFEDFCGDYGYDEDSRKAEKVYFAVQKEWAGINGLFGDVIEELQEIN